MQAMPPIATATAGNRYSGGVYESMYAHRRFSERPLSVATDIDTEDDNTSEFEEDNFETSPDSPGHRSLDTVSSYDEVQTPRSSHYGADNVQIQPSQSIQGPKGPHLFRTSQVVSQDYSHGFDFGFTVQMSPGVQEETMHGQSPQNRTPVSAPKSRLNLKAFSPLISPVVDLDLYSWTTQEVASWLFALGFEESIIRIFEDNEISGPVLCSLQFDELRELGVPSFAKRHRLWNEIAQLRSGEISQSQNRNNEVASPFNSNSTPDLPQGKRTQRRNRSNSSDCATPSEPLSIVAIEQLIPKQHKCAKGENCTKWRKQQRVLQQLDQEHGFETSFIAGGHILVAGDPANALRPATLTSDKLSPISDAIPSIAASSDVLGLGQTPEFIFHEEKTSTVKHQDPRDHVRQFTRFQHARSYHELPLSPEEDIAFEMFPPIRPHETQTALSNLQSLPRLTIPDNMSVLGYATSTPDDDAATPSVNIRRLHTLTSEIDTPITAIRLEPPARSVSQSVPPNMQYRPQVIHRPESRDQNCRRRRPFGLSPVEELTEAKPPHSKFTYGDGATHAGWMKKRKTRLLRHEWSDQHFRLRGTKLAMHSSAHATDQLPLETIDVDKYAVACSSLASSSKLSAALKSMKFRSDSRHGNQDETAFAFQLVPSNERAKVNGVLQKDLPGKTHHFAVKTRDQRIDWMREVMLAKAMKQKGEGYEVTINGSVM